MKLQITITVDEEKLIKEKGYSSIEEARNEDFDIQHSIEKTLEDFELSEQGITIDSVEVIVEEKNEIYFDEDLSSEEDVLVKEDLMEHFTTLLDETYGSDSYDFVKFHAEDEDDLPDGGWTGNVYVKLGKRVFELNIEFHTDWCGDWSVRANLPDGFTLIGVKEITPEIA